MFYKKEKIRVSRSIATIMLIGSYVDIGSKIRNSKGGLFANTCKVLETNPFERYITVRKAYPHELLFLYLEPKIKKLKRKIGRWYIVKVSRIRK